MKFTQEASRVALIRKRILLIALLGVLATGLVASLSTSIPFYFSARSNLEQITLTTVQSQASLLNNMLEKYQDLASQFTSRTEIRLRLERYTEGQLSAEDLVAYSEPRLKDAMRLSSELLGLIRLGLKGEVLVKIGQTPLLPEMIGQHLENTPFSNYMPSYNLVEINEDTNVIEDDADGDDYFGGQQCHE